MSLDITRPVLDASTRSLGRLSTKIEEYVVSNCAIIR